MTKTLTAESGEPIGLGSGATVDVLSYVAPSTLLPATLAAGPAARITSIDALRGLVMFTMIYVNDIAGADHVPDWMVHFSDRHRGSGMTFVDLVFPAFLFIVGMSIPFALRSRLARRERWWKILGHVLLRAGSLLLLGIMMVNGESGPNTEKMGWPATRWHALMFLSAILAFCSIAPPAFLWRRASDDQRRRRGQIFRYITLGLRIVGFATLIFLALQYRTRRDGKMISFYPTFFIRTDWYGILGLIGWAYLAGAIVYLIFRNHRTALLACVAIMTAFFAADKHGFFNHFFLSRYVDMGGTLGSQAAITVAGVMLATILLTPNTISPWSRVRFTLLFVLGFAAAAIVTTPLYGISKNDATPAWCLWACAITAALWLVFYLIGDVARARWLIWPFAIAGANVLLAYLISEGMESWFKLLHLSNWYGRLAEPDLTHAIARSAACAAVILALTAVLNRVGFRLKL